MGRRQIHIMVCFADSPWAFVDSSGTDQELSSACRSVLSSLVRRGWVEGEPGNWSLTEAGIEIVRLMKACPWWLYDA